MGVYLETKNTPVPYIVHDLCVPEWDIVLLPMESDLMTDLMFWYKKLFCWQTIYRKYK